jgi:hypothetical protein
MIAKESPKAPFMGVVARSGLVGTDQIRPNQTKDEEATSWIL